MQGSSIAVEELACRRGDRLLFHGLSFALGPGEALRVAGRNGVGKSSLLRLLAGLAPALAGRIAVEGGIGLIDERHALDAALPLSRALAFWQRLDATPPGQTAAALDRLGLRDLTDVPVRYLSTGQKKRAALARLIGQNATVWLLDEPLNGLDREAAALCETLVAEHCRAGGLAVIASHQPFALTQSRELALEEYRA